MIVFLIGVAVFTAFDLVPDLSAPILLDLARGRDRLADALIRALRAPALSLRARHPAAIIGVPLMSACRAG
jgi:hypothetical protein